MNRLRYREKEKDASYIGKKGVPRPVPSTPDTVCSCQVYIYMQQFSPHVNRVMVG